MTKTRPPFRADVVGSILRTAPLKEARAKREQSEMSNSLEQYGLKEPQIVVTLKKGDQEWKLNVGKDTGKSGVAYVTTNNRRGATDEYNTLKRLDPARAAKLLAVINGR